MRRGLCSSVGYTDFRSQGSEKQITISSIIWEMWFSFGAAPRRVFVSDNRHCSSVSLLHGLPILSSLSSFFFFTKFWMIMNIFLGYTLGLTIKSLLNQFLAINVFLMNFAFLTAGPYTICLLSLMPLASSLASCFWARGRKGCPLLFYSLSPASFSTCPFPQHFSLGNLIGFLE